MKIRYLLFCFALLFLSMTSLSSAADLKSLSDVDLISVSAYEKDGVLKISLHYTNRYKDELVFWQKGKVNCSCSIYENIGSILDEKKGQKVLQMNKTLYDCHQDFYVDIPERCLNKGKRGIIECSVDTGYKRLRATNEFSFGGSAISDESQTRNHQEKNPILTLIDEIKQNTDDEFTSEEAQGSSSKYKIWKDEEGVVHIEEP